MKLTIITLVGILAAGTAQADSASWGYRVPALVPAPTQEQIAAGRAQRGMEGELPAIPYWVQNERLKRELKVLQPVENWHVAPPGPPTTSITVWSTRPVGPSTEPPPDPVVTWSGDAPPRKVQTVPIR